MFQNILSIRVKLFIFFFCRLSYLHSQKIVHRDVKTENMLLDKTRTLKIADFGVARIEASNPNDMTGETGTLGYMAPEVFTLLASTKLSKLISLHLSFFMCMRDYNNHSSILEFMKK